MRAALLLVLAACGGQAAAPPPAPVPAPTVAVTGEYRFDWTPPCRVPVTERTFRKANDITLRYTVEVTRHDEGVLSVEMVDVVPLRMNGTDMSGPAHGAERAHLQKMYSAFPAVLVGDDGSYLGTESLDEIIAFTIETSPHLASAAAMFDSPEMREQMAGKFAEPWITWVAHWIEWSLGPGERGEVDLTAPLADGSEIPYHAVVEHLGIEDGHARLRYVERLEGESLKRFMEPTLRSLAGIASDPAEAQRIFEEMTLEGSREGTYEVLISPADLRPRWARQAIRVDATIDGEPMEREHEWRKYHFDWDRAVGCGR